MNWHKEWALPSIGHTVPPLGGMKVSWPPTFQKPEVNNSVPHLWKAVDLWEGACMEASINFQNVTGLDNNTLFPSPCALECFLVKRPRSNLSSLVSSSSRSARHPCLSLQIWKKTCYSTSSSHTQTVVCSTFAFTFNDMVLTLRNYIEYIKNEQQAHCSLLCIENYRICV